MTPSDIDLLSTYAGTGDEAAFAELAGRHAGWILAAARRQVGDEHLADDVLQAVLLLLSQKAAVVVGHPSLPAWLFRVMHFACSRSRRDRQRRGRHESRPRERGGVTPIDDAVVVAMEDAIAQLPPAEREIVVRRFYQRESFPQIGQSLNLSADAVRKRLERAIIVVRQSMRRDGVVDAGEFELAVRDAPVIKPTPAVDALAKGTDIMMQQSQAVNYEVMTAEFFVKDVEANLAFFEKLGFQSRWRDEPDAMGRLPRASLVSGPARIWLRRAAGDENVRPTPGSCTLFFWVNGGPDGLASHRKSIADQGVAVSPFVDDVTLRNFTVATPDGYTIGFFTSHK